MSMQRVGTIHRLKCVLKNGRNFSQILTTPSSSALHCTDHSSTFLTKKYIEILKRIASQALALERHYHTRYEHNRDEKESRINLPKPDYDWDYLTNPLNKEQIRQNILHRKGVGDIDKLQKLWHQISECSENRNSHELLSQLHALASDIPNTSHQDSPIGDETQNKTVEVCGEKREFNFKPKTVVELGEDLGLLRTSNLGLTSGPRTYYFVDGFARLEQALIRYTIDKLLQERFSLMSIPDLIHPSIIEGCGFKTTGERTQVYKLDPKKHGSACLAGTGEMPLAGYFMNKTLSVGELPRRVAAVSRCYRAETSTAEEESGIYRVHQFTKVEMFLVSPDETGEESDEMLQEILNIQKQLFSPLGLHYRILDMASEELGAPAHRKYDMETWMPAKEFWGEISSSSSCTDFQSRRLNIRYHSERTGKLAHAHTLNGTACALPRMIMAIAENYQMQDGTIGIPRVLQPYMGGDTVITRSQNPTQMKWKALTKGLKKQLKAKKTAKS